MSGFAGIVNFDGAPVDRELISRMAAYMAFRGPDEQRVWIHPEGHVAFAYAKLTTTFEMERETQPCTMDGKTYLVGHIRVDARDELWPKLEAKGFPDVRKAPDANLVWMAYQAWGERCVDHLIGDFSFAIWDDRERKLFCARDHMGVRLFYYSHQGETLIFSNTLDCVRMHPEVGDELDNLAVVDFLMLGYKLDPAATTFRCIKRVRNAEIGVWSGKDIKRKRYWRPPIEPLLNFSGLREVVETVAGVVTSSIRDRLRHRKAAFYLSGGVDSPVLAALAVRELNHPISAHSTIFEKLIPDSERPFIEEVCQRLDLVPNLRCRDTEVVDSNWFDYCGDCPEPVPYPFSLRFDRDYARAISADSRVLVEGEGPDNVLLYEWQTYARWALRSGNASKLGRSLLESLRFDPRIPYSFWLRNTMVRRNGDHDSSVAPDHGWILRCEGHSEHIEKLSIGSESGESRTSHPIHPVAYEGLCDSSWVQELFTYYDAGHRRIAMEAVHPTTVQDVLWPRDPD